MNASETADLKWLHKNKKIVKKYEDVILKVLKAYPELKGTCIHFKLAKKHPVPYGTVPTLSSLFKAPAKRVYIITILENSKGPEEKALFKNLTTEAQMAVIAHELGHVVLFNSMSPARLIKATLQYPLPYMKRAMERGADAIAIEHGFGDLLYDHAVYLRSIPGYIQKRPDLNMYYLQPFEIMLRLSRKMRPVK